MDNTSLTTQTKKTTPDKISKVTDITQQQTHQLIQPTIPTQRQLQEQPLQPQQEQPQQHQKLHQQQHSQKQDRDHSFNSLHNIETPPPNKPQPNLSSTPHQNNKHTVSKQHNQHKQP